MQRVYAQPEGMSLFCFDLLVGAREYALIDRPPQSCGKLCYAWCKAGRRAMPVGMFRSEEGWVQVDYGTGTSIPIPRSKYEGNKYKPDFDKLPSEAEYLAAEKKTEDDAKGS
jgi:hypothetical protein